MDIRFEVESNGRGSYAVRPHVDGVAQERFAFEADFTNERLRRHLAQIEVGGGICTRDDLLNVGSVLWNAISPKALRDQITNLLTTDDGRAFLRLDLPVEGGLDDLPWEAM